MDEMVLAYRTVTEDKTIKQELPADIKLPVIKENGTIVNGKEKIERYLLELESELNYSRSVSGDGCYYDPDSGKLC